MTDREQMPQSPDAERAILGALLIDPRAYFRVQPIVDASDFREGHAAIFEAMGRIAKTGGEIDQLLVKSELRGAGQLEMAGGGAYVSGLLDVVPDIVNVERYANVVHDKAKLRRIILANNAAMRAAMEPDASADEIAGQLLGSMSNLATREESQARPLHRVIHETYATLERRMNGEAAGGLTTGFPELDRHRAIRRTFIALGSPSQHGKTGMMVNLAEGLASNGHAVAIFSLESTEEETALRYVSSVGQVSHGRVQDWKFLIETDWERLAHAERTAYGQKIFLTRRIRSVEEIYAECRRLKAVAGLDAILVDYIQLVRMLSGPREREERVAVISQTFLEMAIDLGIAVIVTSQLTEERKQRSDGRLHQSDLKYARAIGEAARVVLLFQRPYADDKAGPIPPCEVKFQIEKNNEGLTNDYAWHFNESTQTFREGGCDANGCHRGTQQKVWV